METGRGSGYAFDELPVVGDWGREGSVSQNACADAMAAVAPSLRASIADASAADAASHARQTLAIASATSAASGSSSVSSDAPVGGRALTGRFIKQSPETIPKTSWATALTPSPNPNPYPDQV